VDHILPEILDESLDAGVAWSWRWTRRLLNHLPGVCDNGRKRLRNVITTIVVSLCPKRTGGAQ
jgi:hypothetical protein